MVKKNGFFDTSHLFSRVISDEIYGPQRQLCRRQITISVFLTHYITMFNSCR